jgi:hypothetical protein
MIEFIMWWALSACFLVVAGEAIDSWDGFGSWTRFVPRIVVAVIIVSISADLVAQAFN